MAHAATSHSTKTARSIVVYHYPFCQRVFRDYFTSIGLKPKPGFAAIGISILFLGGVQLICLGIIGEDLGRIYDEVKGWPQWIVRESVEIEAKPVARQSVGGYSGRNPAGPS